MTTKCTFEDKLLKTKKHLTSNQWKAITTDV